MTDGGEFKKFQHGNYLLMLELKRENRVDTEAFFRY